MISIQVRAVIKVSDGYTGKAVGKNAVRCILDGQPVSVEHKNGGYLILSNLGPGRHALLLKGAYFQDEAIELDTPETGWEELAVSLKPSARYPFGGAFTRLTVRKKGGEDPGRLWLAGKNAAMELRLAQDAVSAGDTKTRLYYRGSADTAPLHVPLMISDGPQTEIAQLVSCADGTGTLAKPLRFGHRRGARLYPAECYQFDENGALSAAFREPVSVTLFLESGGEPVELDLKEGENDISI